MRKILMVLIFGLVTLGEISAQDSKRINYQLDFGTTLTVPYKKSIVVMPELDAYPQTYSSGFGCFLEALVSYNLNSKYSINTGLNYNFTTVDMHDINGLFEDKGNLTNSSLTIPVLMKCRLSEKIPISISAGPYLSILISAKEKGTTYIDTAGLELLEPDPAFDAMEPTRKFDTDIKKDYTAFDYGVSLQLDYEIILSQELKGVILTRMNYGLKDVLTNDLENRSIAEDWKNFNLMIGFGLKF